jgi:hypothetical protein
MYFKTTLLKLINNSFSHEFGVAVIVCEEFELQEVFSQGLQFISFNADPAA